VSVTEKRVVVVGGGVAGVAAATALATAGLPVTLLEAAPGLGGRARSFVDRTTGDAVDNGQHALMGCYDEFLALLVRLGRRGDLYERELDVPLWDESRGLQHLVCPRLPAPLHFAAGVLRFRHLSARERVSALRAGRALVSRYGRGGAQGDRATVAEALAELGQGARARRALWDPLAWATLNADPERASARLLATVVERALLGSRAASRFLLPAVPLSELYAEPARKLVEERGGSVHCRTAAEALVFERGRVSGVRTGGETLPAAAVVLAVPPAPARRLLSPALARLVPPALDRATPIVSVTLWLDRPIGGPDFVGLLGAQTQWIFRVDRIHRPPDGHADDRAPARLACVRSGASDWVERPTREIAEIVLREARAALPDTVNAVLRHALVVKEVAATLAPDPELQPLRPAATLPVPNLFLAGDWTSTGLPATLEGAALSGHRAAALATVATLAPGDAL